MDHEPFRYVVANRFYVPERYRILGLLRMHFKPIPITFADDIANPKDKEYLRGQIWHR